MNLEASISYSDSNEKLEKKLATIYSYLSNHLNNVGDNFNSINIRNGKKIYISKAPFDTLKVEFEMIHGNIHAYNIDSLGRLDFHISRSAGFQGELIPPADPIKCFLEQVWPNFSEKVVPGKE